MFFLSYILAALSFLAAPVIARRAGVVKTMAFSHGLASVLYLCLPLAPTFSVAAAMTVFRSFLAYMDNPLRNSFIMGVVRPEDRGAAAGITTLSRHVPVTVSPTLSAYMMQAFSLNIPIALGGLFATGARLRFLPDVPRRQAAGGAELISLPCSRFEVTRRSRAQFRLPTIRDSRSRDF
jgi:predicted MFS family arabinose efflux permease